MLELFATYGPSALAWVLAALGALLGKYLWQRMKAGYIADALQRAWVEVQGAVLEVAQTYADALKARSAGGLTDVEKAEAKALAIGIAKANIGSKGLQRLARVLGVNLDTWLASKTEQAVKLLSNPTAPLSPPSPT
jgi:hypothetical protein